MEVIREKVTLVTGIPVGEKVLYEAVLRPAVLVDTYRATASVPIPESMDGLSERIAFQMRVDDAVILSQICDLGEVGTPLPGLDELPDLIDPEDMVLLREAVARLKTKQREARSARREHGEQASSAPSAPAS